MDKPLLEKLFEYHNRPLTIYTEDECRTMKPSKRVINNILNFSKALSVSPSKQIGHVSYLMN